MAQTQIRYTEDMGQAVAIGQVADTYPVSIDTYEAAEDIPFGRAITINASGQATMIPAATASAQFAGVSVRETTRSPLDVWGTGDGANRGGLVKKGGNVAVLTHGDVWLEVTGTGIAIGDTVGIATTGGATAAGTFKEPPTDTRRINGAVVRGTGYSRDLSRAAAVVGDAVAGDTALVLVRFSGGEVGPTVAP